MHRYTARAMQRPTAATPKQPPDLARLLGRVALHDRAAFEALYRATSSHLLGIAVRVLGQRERAEEVLQEAYMNIWNSASSYSAAMATPMTWMINIVRNKAIDVARSGRTEKASTVELDDEFDAPAGGQWEPHHLFDESLTKLNIDSCMSSLSASQRQALALAYYRGMVHTEIAEALNAPLGTAKAWVRRGLDKLKDCLQAAGIEPA